MTDPDEPDDKAADEAEDEERERLQEALLDDVDAFMEEEDLDDTDMVELLIEVAVRLRMASYGTHVDKPSVAGFKLDLDRFGQMVGDVLREAKKGAEGYVTFIKETRARQKDEPGGDPQDE